MSSSPLAPSVTTDTPSASPAPLSPSPATERRSSKAPAPPRLHSGRLSYVNPNPTQKIRVRCWRCPQYSLHRHPLHPHALISQRITFLHAAMGSPALSTLCRAIDAGFLTTIPEITSMLVRKYPPPSVPMIKGRLDQIRKNLWSMCPVL